MTLSSGVSLVSMVPMILTEEKDYGKSYRRFKTVGEAHGLS